MCLYLFCVELLLDDEDVWELCCAAWPPGVVEEEILVGGGAAWCDCDIDDFAVAAATVAAAAGPWPFCLSAWLTEGAAPAELLLLPVTFHHV